MTDNTMAEAKRTKGQTTIYKTLHRKLKIDQHEPNSKPGGELMQNLFMTLFKNNSA